ncbi:PKD domain-containing protein [Vibrio sp. YMD68]|uniref:PKD domain-containing protein n=1 Tax=Vibrio sp. YMD68 TaxID=3042300 RepID=UPI00249A7656|nr:PKD domain-containing protein [Vibrio sp. YMD68]WGV98273.1 PKD domain-containing protein [Vibrio sp. YMD68]
MKRIVPICVLIAGTYSTLATAAPEWEKKSYSGGVQVCHEQMLFKSKWWAGSYNEPNPLGALNSSQAGWGNDPWLPIPDSSECGAEQDNQAPIANAGADLNIQSPRSSVSLDGSGSQDADGDPLIYRWQQVSGPTVSLKNSQQAQATFVMPELAKDTDYTFQLTVDDGEASSKDQVTVKGLAVVVENTPPTANAGADLNIQSPRSSVSLDGSGSQDADGDPLVYRWQQVSGPTVSLKNSQQAQATFVMPELAKDTDYTFQLTVDDGEASSKDQVTVKGLAVVVENTPPTANAGADLKVQSPHSSVSLDGAGSQDEDGDVLSYHWQQVSGPSVTLQNPKQPKATFALPELTEDTDYAFQLTVDDGEASSQDQITVTGLAAVVENTPPTADAGTDQEVQSPASTVRLDGAGSQDAEGDELTYQWRQLSGDEVSLNNADSAVATFSIPGLSQESHYSFELAVSDGETTSKDTVQVYALAELEQQEPGSIVIEMDQGGLGIPSTSTYEVVLTSLTTGESQRFEMTAQGDQQIIDLAPDEYQVWVEFEDDYQPINVPRVIAVTDEGPMTLAFRVKPSVDLEKLSTIDGVEVSTIIDGVFQARQMTWGDGYLYVGSSAISEENGARGNKIYAIPYDYRTGLAGDPVIVASGLVEPHGVAFKNGDLYFATSAELFRIKNVASNLGQPSEPEKLMDLPAGDDNFPLEPVGLYWHQKHTLKFNTFDNNDENLYVSIGSPCNICVIEEEVKYGSILAIDLQTLDVKQIADGIRNTVGFDWDPRLGDLWFTDNNPQNTDGHNTYFPGEINKISASQLADKEMPHFGFPYVSGVDTLSITEEQENGTSVYTGGYDYLPPGAIYSDILIEDIDPAHYQAPEFELEAGSAPLGLTFWQPDGITPTNGQSSFVYATHGPGDGKRAGYELRIMTLDSEGKPIFDRSLITGWKQPEGISGKPVEMLVMPDNSLLVSDDAGNTLYRLQYNPTSEGRIELSPTKGEITDTDTLVEATLTDSDGVSRRLFMSLSSGGYTIDHLEYGDYTLVIPTHEGLEPTESVYQITVNEQQPLGEVSWSYEDDSGDEKPLGTVTVNAPGAPSNSAPTILLEMEAAEGGTVYIDSEWGETTTAEMNIGQYTVDFPYTGTAIPSPKQQDVNLSASGATLNWTYTEYDNDEDYFNAVMEGECSGCHNGGNFAPDLSEGPSTGLIENYYDNPNIIADKIAEMTDMPGVTCDSTCQETLTRYLEDDLWGDALPNIVDSAEVYGSRHLRLLGQSEYINTVNDLFNVEVEKSLLPLDDKEKEGSLYGNAGQLGYLSSDKMNSYLNAAVYIQDNMDIYALSQCKSGGGSVPEWQASQVYVADDKVVDGGEVYRANWWTQGNPPKENSAPYGQPWTYVEDYEAGDPDCLENWYWETAERMFKRPLTDTDKALYPASDIELSLAKILVSPHFLYRREGGNLNDEGNYHLNAYELANVISYTVVGSVPDEELWSAAKDDSLIRSDVMAQQIDRLLSTPQAYEQFANFMMQTLEFDEERVVVDRDGMSSDVGEAMLDEFTTYIRETVFGEEMGRFSDLMAYENTYVNQVLANHYGFNGSFNSGFKQAAIPAERGTGLLSLGAIAVAYSTDEQTRLIPRGKMVQHSLLGWEQAIPSGAAPDDIVNDTSTKDFWTQATGPSTECWVCHEKMNDVGFAYDVLDKTGRYRAYEDYTSLHGEVFNNVALETQGTLIDVDGTDTQFDDLEDISLYLANSEQAKQAFVKNYLSYTLGEVSARFSPLYPEYASFEQFKQLMKDLLMSTTVIEREE